MITWCTNKLYSDGLQSRLQLPQFSRIRRWHAGLALNGDQRPLDDASCIRKLLNRLDPIPVNVPIENERFLARLKLAAV